MTPFDVAFNYLISKDEGSKYVNNPSDSGGATRWGITKKTYQNFFSRETVFDSEIEFMPASTAKQIYTALYWLPLSCDRVQDLGIAIALFDSAVLYGVGTAGLLAQRALEQLGVAIKLDGIFGDRSAELLNRYVGGDPTDRFSFMLAFQCLIRGRIDEIVAAHPKDEEFKTGWIDRTARLIKLLDDEQLNQFKQEMFT